MSDRSERFGLIGSEDHRVLADALGDTPQTLVPIHILNHDLGRAYIAGDPANFEAAVIQDRDYPGEIDGFGSNAEALAGLLQMVEGWYALEVEDEIAFGLGNLLETQYGEEIVYSSYIFHTLTRPVVPFTDESVRLLTTDDIGILEASVDYLRGSGWGSSRKLLEEGIMAGAIVDGELVSNSFTAARSQRHADVAINTRDDWGGRGLATAGASLVASEIQRAGQTPVWECAEEQRSCIKLARRLGFTPVSRRTVLMQERYTVEANATEEAFV